MSEQDKNKLAQGVLISGICKGAKTTVDGDYTNHDLGISIREPDGYGGFTESLETVSLRGDNVQEIINKANELKGKHVVISVARTAQTSRAGNTYLQQRSLSDSYLQVIV